jgi:hypothetical protein
MEDSERVALASAIEDLVALTRVSTMVAPGRQQTELARALGSAVAALGDRLGRDGDDAAAVRPALTGAVAKLRAYVTAEHRTMAALAEALQLVTDAVAASAAGIAARPQSTATTVGSTDPAWELVMAAEPYAIDARRSARTTIWLYIGGIALVAGALLLQWLLILDQSPRPGSGDFLVQSLPFLFVLVLSALIFVHASRQRRTTEELRRVERQLRTLPGYVSYLTPLPSATQALLRSVLLQRLFPRLSDDDLLREPDSFPSMDYLMASIADDDYQGDHGG